MKTLSYFYDALKIKQISKYSYTLSLAFLFLLFVKSINAQVTPMALWQALNLSPTSINTGSSGTVEQVYVETQNNCTYYLVTENLDWVYCTKAGMTVTVNISTNSGNARSGNITIGGMTVIVNQACGNYPSPAGGITGTNSVCAGQTGVSYSVLP